MPVNHENVYMASSYIIHPSPLHHLIAFFFLLFSPSHALQYRRYGPIVADLKFVLNIPGVSAHFALTCLDTWSTTLLEVLQYLHSQKRQEHVHVSYESRDWMFAFNIEISLCHVLDCLMTWVRTAGGPDGETETAVMTMDDCAPHEATPKVLEFGRHLMGRIAHWQQKALFEKRQKPMWGGGDSGENDDDEDDEEEEEGQEEGDRMQEEEQQQEGEGTGRMIAAKEQHHQQQQRELIKHLPIYPQGSMEAIKLPKRRSFHIILHRALAFLICDAVKNPYLLQAQQQLPSSGSSADDSISSSSSGSDGKGELALLVDHLREQPRLVLGLLEVGYSFHD